MSGRDRNVNEVTVSSDYTVPIDMDYVFCDNLAADITITLKRTKDRLIRAHKVEKSDASAFTVTVTDGTLSYVLSAEGQGAVFEIDAEGNFHVFASNEMGDSGGWLIPAGSSITYSPAEYGGLGSFQPIAPDLNLAAGAGDDTDVSYIGTVMANILGDALTKTKNVIAAVIAKLSITGARASTYPVAAMVAEVGDGVSDADGGVVAVLGGDSAQTNARAAFTVDNQNSTPGSGFDYGLDLQGSGAHDGYPAVEYLQADIRFSDGTTQSTAASGVEMETPTGDVDGVNDEFVFTSPPIFVTYQGAIQTLTVDYTLVGSTVTFTVPPVSGLVQGLVSV